jgi:phospholipid/cholesterol/gamma-HCH transport system permease protein
MHVNSFFYWHYSRAFVSSLDLWSGIIKSICFGAAISLISCHRGFHSRAGAEGVGQAATEAFVYAFIAILSLDFFLGFFLMELYDLLWPKSFLLS